ncbi:MAG: UDP-N-acetylmuramoyl-tripeptide--D-alanyl-D-alanine ligase [Gemmatimonadales bacterium]
MSDEPLAPAGSPGFWTLDRVAAALAGGPAGGHSAPPSRRGVLDATRRTGSAGLRGVATDSRTAGDGDIFVALDGERFDGHDFLAAAVRRGAGAVIVSRPERAQGLGIPVFAVPDTLVALGDLARYRRRAWGKCVIAIAGSNGKTTTKELVRGALGAAFTVHATTANYNNRIGVPLTLLGIPDSADVAVVEMGTNAHGEVALLRAIAEPDVAVVTSIGEEHLEGFGDLAGVLAEESAVFTREILGIVPASETALVAAARARATSVVAAGLGEGDLCASSWGAGAIGEGQLVVDGVPVVVPLPGVHNLRNAMLALAVARACGVPLAVAAAGLRGVASPPMRTAWAQLGRATLINDAYNSNPASARAALDLLDAVGTGRQRVVVLGTMRELGAAGPALHAEIARRALASPFEVIAGVGEFASALDQAGGSDPRLVTAPDIDDLWPRLRERLAPDAVILLKASRGMRLERLVPPLTEWATT